MERLIGWPGEWRQANRDSGNGSSSERLACSTKVGVGDAGDLFLECICRCWSKRDWTHASGNLSSLPGMPAHCPIERHV